MDNGHANFCHLGNNIEINYISCIDLTPYKNNPRTHSKQQVRQIERSIQQFGFTNPVLVDVDHQIIAGHGRVEAAKNLGIKHVPTICLKHLTKAQKKAYVIADNKLAENAGWDYDLLNTELTHLLELDSDFDLTLTGFETPEIDLILIHDEAFIDPVDEFIPDVQDNAVTQLGDLWLLNDHKILCGNALEQASYDLLLGPEKAGMIFTDPPYNVPVNGHVCGNGKIKHREFLMASGEMSTEEFVNFLQKTFKHLSRFSRDGSIHFVCMDWRHIQGIMDAGNSVYTELKNLCVWNKTNGGMGSLYRSKHELVFVFKNGNAPHINNVELGKHGRNRTNVWDYPGVNTPKPQGKNELELHPTVKPVSMIVDAILDCSNYGDIVLDSFGGSGSTLMAAEKVGRKGRLLELDPLYVDVSIRRWQKKAGNNAVNIKTGLSFNEMQKMREEARHG